MKFRSVCVGFLLAAGLALPAAAQSRSAGGEWTGKYVCRQGVTGARLILSADGSRGVFHFFPLPENPRAAEGCYQVSAFSTRRPARSRSFRAPGTSSRGITCPPPSTARSMRAARISRAGLSGWKVAPAFSCRAPRRRCRYRRFARGVCRSKPGDLAFSGDAANYCDEHRSDDAKSYGGNQARKQPLATDHQGAGDYRQTSHHGSSMGKGQSHPAILTQISHCKIKFGRHD